MIWNIFFNQKISWCCMWGKFFEESALLSRHYYTDKLFLKFTADKRCLNMPCTCLKCIVLARHVSSHKRSRWNMEVCRTYDINRQEELMVVRCPPERHGKTMNLIFFMRNPKIFSSRLIAATISLRLTNWKRLIRNRRSWHSESISPDTVFQR